MEAKHISPVNGQRGIIPSPPKNRPTVAPILRMSMAFLLAAGLQLVQKHQSRGSDKENDGSGDAQHQKCSDADNSCDCENFSLHDSSPLVVKETKYYTNIIS